MSFGKRLQDLRTKKKISQVNLSVACDVSQETISSYENDKNMPSCEVLIKMANYLGTTTDYLLGRINTDVSIYQLNKNEITQEEAELITTYKILSKEDKFKVSGYIDALKK